LLIAPKLIAEGKINERTAKGYLVDTYLPSDSEWYFWFDRTKRIIG